MTNGIWGFSETYGKSEIADNDLEATTKALAEKRRDMLAGDGKLLAWRVWSALPSDKVTHLYRFAPKDQGAQQGFHGPADVGWNAILVRYETGQTDVVKQSRSMRYMRGFEDGTFGLGAGFTNGLKNDCADLSNVGDFIKYLVANNWGTHVLVWKPGNVAGTWDASVFFYPFRRGTIERAVSRRTGRPFEGPVGAKWHNRKKKRS